jgi:hypothetical protein
MSLLSRNDATFVSENAIRRISPLIVAISWVRDREHCPILCYKSTTRSFSSFRQKRPEFYFNPLVRANISSFAALSNPKDVEEGLAALRMDIDSNRFSDIARRYESNLGDYVYVVAPKGGLSTA